MKAKNKISKNAKAVENFNVDTYLGTWYEIARFDFRFEKALKNVSAPYSLNTEEISYDIVKLISVKHNKSDNPFLNEK